MASQTELSILVRVKDEATKAFGKIRGDLKGLGTAMTAVGGVLVAGLGAAVKAAADAEVSQSRFETVLKNVSKATNEQVAALRTQQDALQATTRFEGDAIASAQGFLGTFALTAEQIGQVTPHLLDMAEGMRKATGGTMDLEGASNLLGKAIANGSVAGLARVGVTIPGVTAAQQELYEKTFALATQQERVAMVTQLMDGNFKGLAEAGGKTLAGQTEILKNQFGDLMETVGQQLIPVLSDLLTKIAPIITAAANWMKQNPELTKQIVLITAVVGPLLVVLPLLAIAIAALSGPIGVIVLAVGAIILVGTTLQTHWEALKESAQMNWELIKNTVVKAIDEIKGAVSTMFSITFPQLTRVLTLANSVISAVNKATGSNIGTIPGIPAMANGGIVTSPTLAMIGEAGPEAVIPLSRGGGRGFGAGVTINIGTFVGGNPEAAARELGDLIIKRLQLNARVG